MERPYGNARFALTLDNSGSTQSVALVRSISGGEPERDAVQHTINQQSDNVTSRVAGAVKYSDMSIELGMAGAPAFWELMNAPEKNEASSFSGAVIAYDLRGTARAARKFTGVLTEFTLPSLDASSSNAMNLKTSIAVESLSTDKPSGEIKPPAGKSASEQLKWVSNQFSVEFADKALEESGKYATKVDGLTFKREAHDYIANGESGRVKMKVPGRLTTPDTLNITIPTVYAAPFNQRLADYDKDKVSVPFGVTINMWAGTSKKSATDRETLLSIVCEGCVILSASDSGHDASGGKVAMTTLKLAVSTVKLEWPKKVEPAATPG